MYSWMMAQHIYPLVVFSKRFETQKFPFDSITLSTPGFTALLARGVFANMIVNLNVFPTRYSRVTGGHIYILFIY